MNKKIDCIAPSLGKKIYDYHNGFLKEKAAQKFLVHVSACPKCKQTLRRLEWIWKTIQDNPVLFFGRELDRSKVPDTSRRTALMKERVRNFTLRQLIEEWGKSSDRKDDAKAAADVYKHIRLASRELAQGKNTWSRK